jgi:hypothetical protein
MSCRVVSCAACSLQIVLSNRVIKTFEVSVEQFNQLRFGVAKVRANNHDTCND